MTRPLRRARGGGGKALWPAEGTNTDDEPGGVESRAGWRLPCGRWRSSISDSNSVGVYGDVLEDRGIEVERVRLDRGSALPDWREYDLLVVMGGGMSVYEEDAYPWLVDGEAGDPRGRHGGDAVLRCLSRVAAPGVRARRARSSRGPEPELGVSPIFLCEAARARPGLQRPSRPISRCSSGTRDTFDLPPGRGAPRPLPPLREPGVPCRAVAYAIQCHLEPSHDDVRDWFDAWPSLGEMFEARYGLAPSQLPRGVRALDAAAPPNATPAVHAAGWRMPSRPRRPPIGSVFAATTTVADGLLGRA